MSSKRRLRRKECGDKKRYPDIDHAKWAIKRQGKFGKMEAYKCRWCKKWHIGHRPIKKQRYTVI